MISPKPLLHEERVYADVLPFVRIYQGFWSVGTEVFAIYLVYGWLTGVRQEWPLLVTQLIALIVFTALSLWLSVALCRMSLRLGCVMLAYFGGAAGIWVLYIVLYFFALGLRLLVGPPLSLSWHVGIYITLALIFIIPFVYLDYLGIRAGWRFVSSGDETKRIVSEIDTISGLPSGWFSKVLAIPIPMKHLRKHKMLTVTLFIVSGLVFAAFPFLALGSLILIIPAAQTPPDIPAYGPLISAGLAIASLMFGLAARAGARRLMISSIRESQEYDARPPILFLRSFRDDQVELRPARLSLLGRLVNLLQAKGSLDIVLLEEGTAYGPVVAVGEPGEPTPPYGASRGYFSDGDWEKAVSQLAAESRYIVVCLDQTEGVMWEIEHILRHGHGPKTLFVMNPSFHEVEKNKALVQTVIALMPSTIQGLLLNSEEPILGFFFDEGQRPKIGLSREFSEASYLLMVRWFLRTAFDGRIQSN
jgi:hypothetical protein